MEIYQLLHSFDVEVVELRQAKKEGSFLTLVLATAEQAEIVRVAYNKHVPSSGDRVRISYAKPTMRLLGRVSWGQWKTWRVSTYST
jgi:hypothetical protein